MLSVSIHWVSIRFVSIRFVRIRFVKLPSRVWLPVSRATLFAWKNAAHNPLIVGLTKRTSRSIVSPFFFYLLHVLVPKGSLGDVRWGKAGLSAGCEFRKSIVLGWTLSKEKNYYIVWRNLSEPDIISSEVKLTNHPTPRIKSILKYRYISDTGTYLST
jgi:hypothetical protein